MSGPSSSRLMFPEDRITFVYQTPGKPILTPGRTGIKIFLDEAGTIPADILTPAGTPIQYSTIYTEPDCLVPEFLGPEGFIHQVWGRVIGGTDATYALSAQYSVQLANLPTLVTGDGPPSSSVGSVGSFYIDQGLPDPDDPNAVAVPVLYGPRTTAGWPTSGTPLRGDPGPSGSKLEFSVPQAAATWTVPHNLFGRPAVTTLDSAGEEIFGDVSWPPDPPARVVVRWGSPISGTAILT
jgi:hypothetical protein